MSSNAEKELLKAAVEYANAQRDFFNKSIPIKESHKRLDDAHQKLKQSAFYYISSTMSKPYYRYLQKPFTEEKDLKS